MKRGVLVFIITFSFIVFISLIFAISNFVINSPLNQNYNTGEINFNVSASDGDGIDICIYNLNSGVNNTLSREIIKGIGNYTNVSFDLEVITSNNPLGITQNGTYFWVTDSAFDEVYQFYINGTYTNVSFDLAASGNINPRGITQNGTYFWITYLSGNRVYQYWMNGTYTNVSFDTASIGLLNPIGITQNGTYFWITSNLADDEVYKFYMNGTYTGDHFDTAGSGMIDTRHITQNGTYFWITDSTYDSVYRFYMNGTFTGFNFSTATSGNENPFGITQNGTYFWIVSNLQKTAYQYLMNNEYSDNYISTNSSVPEGIYNLSVYCNDTLGEGVLNSSVSFTIDLTAPNVTIISPTSGQSISTSSLSLSVETNENSTCNYSINSGVTNVSLTSNSTGTGNTGTLSGLTTGSYTLNIYCADIAGNTNNTENVSFIVSIPVSSSSDNTGSSKAITYKPTKEQIISGYSKLLTEGNKVNISEEIVEVISVDYDNVEVSFSFNGEVYNLNNEESVKIDSDSDGYYDLEISVSDIRFNGYANFLFKEIYEEIPSDIQEGTDEGIGGIVNEENRIWIYVLLGIVIVGVAVYFLVRGKKRKR